MLRKICKNPQAVIGLLLILIVLIIAIFAPLLAPNDPNAVDVSKKYMEPSDEFPLGTDEVGRCELSRLLYGARYSLGISLPVLMILAILGLFLGTLSACCGEKVDRVMTFICDVFISFPSMIMAIAVVGVLGQNMLSLIVAIVISMWAWFTRMVRSYAIIEMGKDYILGARLSGCGTVKMIFRHLIPNIIPRFIVYLSTGVASSIVTVSSFAFLGIGLPLGTSEWGAMLSTAKNAIFSHPEMLVYPGVCIMIAAAGFNLFGEALRDLISPEVEL